MMSFAPSTPLPNPQYKRNSFESSASPLFSPSAAARYAAQTEQWNQVPSLLHRVNSQVDKWLARVFYPNRVPEFERNEETLTYLYTLSGISNQRTKEKQALHAAQERVIETYKQRENTLETQLQAMGLDIDSLDAQTMDELEELVQIGMTVGLDPVNATTFGIAKAVSEQIGTEQELQLRLHEIKSLQTTLDHDLAKMQMLKADLERARGNQDAQQDTVDEKFSEWTRSIKLIQAKTEEYLSRPTTAKVHSLSRDVSDSSEFLTNCG